MAEKKRDIRYINRDFNDFRNALQEYTKTYFANTYNDFTDESTGMMFMELAAYVGDVLSFYTDNQIQETFLTTARQTENVYNMAYMLGYKPRVTTPATVEMSIYQQVPAVISASVNIPDYSYALKIGKNTQITSPLNTDVKFLLGDEVDFTFSSSMDTTEVSVYSISGEQPNYFLLKKKRKAISATIETKTFTFGSPEKFQNVDITDTNIIGILDVTDSDGNIWYEVPNLAQETIYNTIKNSEQNDPNLSADTEVPNILRLKQVQRRFATRFIDKTTLRMEFGAGTTNVNDEEIIPNPDNVGIGLPFERNKLETAYSPLNFMFTNTYGIAPSNTTLTVRYLTGGGISSNLGAGALTGIAGNISFVNSTVGDNTLANTVYGSVAVNNEKAADGGQDGDTLKEIKQNAVGNFQTQLRAVTPQDYLVRALSMPSNLGTISKAFIAPAKIGDYQLGELPAILDLYVLSYDSSKQLQSASSTLKHNLRTYLTEYRSINDKVNIKDAFVINIGVNFDIIVLPNYNNNEVLTKCITALIDYFDISKWQINQPILLKELFVLLDKIDGVQTVKKVEITNKSGGNYSEYAYDVEGATMGDVVYPSVDPMCFELKFPQTDIKGRVSPL